jgi:hypothetical protein
VNGPTDAERRPFSIAEALASITPKTPGSWELRHWCDDGTAGELTHEGWYGRDVRCRNCGAVARIEAIQAGYRR